LVRKGLSLNHSEPFSPLNSQKYKFGYQTQHNPFNRLTNKKFITPDDSPQNPLRMKY